MTCGRSDIVPILRPPRNVLGNHEVVGFETEARTRRGGYGDQPSLEPLGHDGRVRSHSLRVVTEAQKASASLLQRRLKVGYARAARLLDIMENKGVIGPGDGAKPREVYEDKISEDSA